MDEIHSHVYCISQTEGPFSMFRRCATQKRERKKTVLYLNDFGKSVEVTSFGILPPF